MSASARPVQVSPDVVRRVVVSVQRIPAPHSGPEQPDAQGEPESPFRSAADVLRGIGLMQLDPLTRVSTAQRLTALTRLSATHHAADVDAALWPRDEPVGFEAFTKVACLFPLQDWPLLRLRRERVREQTADVLDPRIVREIRAVVADSARGVQIGAIERAMGSERTTGWDWSSIKKTAELMVRTGDLVITARDGVVRLFDLPERALPEHIRAAEELPREHLLSALAHRAAGSLAVMTVKDCAHHYHLTAQDAAAAIELAGLIPVEVPGWKETAYVTPQVLEQAADADEFATSEITGAEQRKSSLTGLGQFSQARLVGPFDPLLRDRGRASRIFDFDYRFEAYVPKDKRIYGHYVMAVLSGDRMIGRVDIQRSGAELIINRVFAEQGVPARSVQARAKAAGATLARQLGVDFRLFEG